MLRSLEPPPSSPPNVAARLADAAARAPGQPALVWPARRGRVVQGHPRGRSGWRELSFAELNRLTDDCAEGLRRAGLARGTRTILMVPPGPEFFALTFALLRLGAVAVLIDPGMGLWKMAQCLAGVRAEAFIGVPAAHAMRVLFRRAFRGVRVAVTVGRRWFWGGRSLEAMVAGGCVENEFSTPQARHVVENGFAAGTSVEHGGAADSPAAILFTTGSTGPPKGAVYTHATFEAQVQLLRSQFGLRPGEVDLATFPLFALFDAALGVTAVIPDMDPTRPGFADPRTIIATIRQHGCTTMFGSPALLDRVGRFGAAAAVKLPGLKRVISAGAAVRPDVLERFASMLDDDARIHTPYGATEALPVACIDHREVLEETAARTARGEGTCVGRPVEGVAARIIRINDEPILTWSDDLILAPTQGMAAQDRGHAAPGDAPAVGQPEATVAPASRRCDSNPAVVPDFSRCDSSFVGEIVVKGPVVTRDYFGRPEATALAMIADGDEAWRRMGDLGWMDERGRLWFCGRKSHRVVAAGGVLLTEPCEAIFNRHPRVRRTALVGVGAPPRQRPVLCVEPAEDVRRADRARLAEELLALGRAHDLTRGIDAILFHPRFPVDIRHNAKIFREKLAAWAARRT